MKYCMCWRQDIAQYWGTVSIDGMESQEQRDEVLQDQRERQLNLLKRERDG